MPALATAAMRGPSLPDGGNELPGSYDKIWTDPAKKFDDVGGIEVQPMPVTPQTQADAPMPGAIAQADTRPEPRRNAEESTKARDLRRQADGKMTAALVAGLIGLGSGGALAAGLTIAPEILGAIGMGAAGVFFGFSLFMIYKMANIVVENWEDLTLLPIVLNSLGAGGGILLGALCLLNPLAGGIAVSAALAVTGMALAGFLTPSSIANRKKAKELERQPS